MPDKPFKNNTVVMTRQKKIFPEFPKLPITNYLIDVLIGVKQL